MRLKEAWEKALKCLLEISQKEDGLFRAGNGRFGNGATDDKQNS